MTTNDSHNGSDSLHRLSDQVPANTLDPRRLVFIDETWAKTNMTRRHGRALRGRRLVAKVPHGRWRTLTFLAALRCDHFTTLATLTPNSAAVARHERPPATEPTTRSRRSLE